MKDLTAVYTEEYNLIKKQVKAQALLIVALIITALISVFYNMKLTIEYKALNQEKQALENLTEVQSNTITKLRGDNSNLGTQIEELKEEYVYGFGGNE